MRLYIRGIGQRATAALRSTVRSVFITAQRLNRNLHRFSILALQGPIGYMVERRVVISGQWTRSLAVEDRVCEVTLTGLHPGQVYQFRVRAYNALGWSDASTKTQPYRVPFDPDSGTAPFFVQALRDATVMEHEKVRHCVIIS